MGEGIRLRILGYQCIAKTLRNQKGRFRVLRTNSLILNLVMSLRRLVAQEIGPETC